MLIARDRTGAATDAMIETVDSDSIQGHRGVVQKETLLITDGEKAYAALAQDLRADARVNDRLEG